MIDNGLRNAVSFRASSDRVRLLENAVFLELKRRGGDQNPRWDDNRDVCLEMDLEYVTRDA